MNNQESSQHHTLKEFKNLFYYNTIVMEWNVYKHWVFYQYMFWFWIPKDHYWVYLLLERVVLNHEWFISSYYCDYLPLEGFVLLQRGEMNIAMWTMCTEHGDTIEHLTANNKPHKQLQIQISFINTQIDLYIYNCTWL